MGRLASCSTGKNAGNLSRGLWNVAVGNVTGFSMSSRDTTGLELPFLVLVSLDTYFRIKISSFKA